MEKDKRWGVLYCPKHDDLKKNKRWRKIEKCLNDSGISYDFVQSESMAGVERLVRMLINNGYKTIVIVGGDSALNDAVNCLMSIESKERNEISLGVIPNGLINDFAHFWGLKENEVEKAVDALKKRRIRKIDLGCMKYRNSKNEPCHRFFLNCVNIGFIANVMNIRRQTRHFLGSAIFSFVPSLVLLMFQRLEYKMHLKINTDDIRRNVMTVCVGNASGYGQTPNAVPYNGMLDVSVVYHPEVVRLFEGIYLFLKGKFLNHKSVHPYRTQKVEVLDAQKALVGVDGRLVKPPMGSYSIAVEQEVINFIIP